MNSARPYGDQVSATTLFSSKYYYASFSINPFRTIFPQRLMKSQWNIYDGGFCKNSLRLLAVNYFRQKLCRTCLTEFWKPFFSLYFNTLVFSRVPERIEV